MLKYDNTKMKCSCIVCQSKVNVKDCKCKTCHKCRIHIGPLHEEKELFKNMCFSCWKRVNNQ